MACIFAISSISNTPDLPGQSDKNLHGLLYGGLSLLTVRALAGGWRRRVTWSVVLLATTLAALYGMSDEYHQSFVPRRSADPFDVVADTVGAAIAALLCLVLSRLMRWPDASGTPV
jgi:VanZ family protein